MDHMNKWVNIILLITNLAKLTYGWLQSHLHHKIEKKKKKNVNEMNEVNFFASIEDWNVKFLGLYGFFDHFFECFFVFGRTVAMVGQNQLFGFLRATDQGSIFSLEERQQTSFQKLSIRTTKRRHCCG